MYFVCVFFASQACLEACDEKKIVVCQNVVSYSGRRSAITHPIEPKEADMFSNNLNGAYEYESERRNDERRTAAENHLAHELGGRRKFSLSSPMVIIGALTVLIAFFLAF